MIPFEVPEIFLEAVASGALRRIGATLRDQATGRIVAHLQETGLLQGLLGVVNPVGWLLSGGQLASSLAANAQLARVTAMLSTLQMLGGASLAASAAGVGVSAAGFALVLNRLQHLEGAVAGVHRDVIAARLTAERVDVRLATEAHARTEHLLQQAEEAWVRSDAASVWGRVEGPLDEVQRYWRGLVGGRVGPPAFLDPRFSLEEAAAAYAAVLTLSAARVRTLMLINQDRAALHHAEEVDGWHEKALTNLTPVDVAAARSKSLAEAEGTSEQDARGELVRRAGRLFEGVREVQLRLGDRAALVRALIAKGVRGREYVETLRGRTDAPVLLLPGS